ncbi:hypothetical protein [Staphylococcus saccharolyticus]|uniref:hypothetical protein n=1 Tax=Staphylococcus saccharolyticus TaxID=33028 RepID=UPI001E47DC45|nr:hypothetical protein [Staphylococcus saccharolyticus]
MSNHSKQQFLVQRNHNDISIVEPLENDTFKILVEINISDENKMNVYDNTLYVFIKNLEISIFGRN